MKSGRTRVLGVIAAAFSAIDQQAKWIGLTLYVRGGLPLQGVVALCRQAFGPEIVRLGFLARQPDRGPREHQSRAAARPPEGKNSYFRTSPRLD